MAYREKEDLPADANADRDADHPHGPIVLGKLDSLKLQARYSVHRAPPEPVDRSRLMRAVGCGLLVLLLLAGLYLVLGFMAAGFIG